MLMNSESQFDRSKNGFVYGFHALLRNCPLAAAPTVWQLQSVRDNQCFVSMFWGRYSKKGFAGNAGAY